MVIDWENLTVVVGDEIVIREIFPICWKSREKLFEVIDVVVDKRVKWSSEVHPLNELSPTFEILSGIMNDDNSLQL